MVCFHSWPERIDQLHLFPEANVVLNQIDLLCEVFTSILCLPELFSQLKYFLVKQRILPFSNFMKYSTAVI